MRSVTLQASTMTVSIPIGYRRPDYRILALSPIGDTYSNPIGVTYSSFWFKKMQNSRLAVRTHSPLSASQAPRVTRFPHAEAFLMDRVPIRL